MDCKISIPIYYKSKETKFSEAVMNSYTEVPIVNSSKWTPDSISVHAAACDNPSMELSLEWLKTSLLLPSLCTVLLSMIALILSVDQKRYICLLGPAGILMMYITFGYSIIRTVTSLGLLFYIYEAYVRRHRQVEIDRKSVV